MGRDHPVSSLFSTLSQHPSILWTTYLLVKHLLSEWHITKQWEKKEYTLSENHLYQNSWHDYFLNQFHFSDFPQTKLLRNKYFNISARGRKGFYNKTMMNASISLVFTEGAHTSVWWETGGGWGTQAKSSGLCNITVLSQIKQRMEKNRFLRRRSSGEGGLGCSAWPLTGLHPWRFPLSGSGQGPGIYAFSKTLMVLMLMVHGLHFEKNNIHPVNILII